MKTWAGHAGEVGAAGSMSRASSASFPTQAGNGLMQRASSANLATLAFNGTYPHPLYPNRKPHAQDERVDILNGFNYTAYMH
jgi:hypothetical protein